MFQVIFAYARYAGEQTLTLSLHISLVKYELIPFVLLDNPLPICDH